jgi:hypothetical protein
MYEKYYYFTEQIFFYNLPNVNNIFKYLIDCTSELILLR